MDLEDLMRNPHARWRIEMAQVLTERLLPFEGIQALVVAGSVARGYADQFSDIELPIFWDKNPSDSTRLEIAAALGGEFIYGYNGPANEDQLLIGGVQVDLWPLTTAREEEVLSAVLEDFSTDLGHLNALETLRSCLPLYGHTIIEGWKERARDYPDGLAEKLIRQHLASFSTNELYLMAQRENPTSFLAQLCHLQQEVFLVLLALNRQFFPTFKWLYRSLETLQIKPKEIGHRFRAAFQVSPEEAAADMVRVLESTLELVERTYPHLDTSAVRCRLSYRRAAHEVDGS
jgi:hypothetical protein